MFIMDIMELKEEPERIRLCNMCGISGIYHFDKEKTVDIKQLKRMTEILRHRGPDGEGIYVKQNIGLGHRRLSIIDLSTGDQPMFNEDKSIALVLNGEIYNYLELKSELSSFGHHFITSSDTEVVIKSYEQWGIECQNKFNGMWAFALWDARKQQLFISRDRIGEKPLNYSVHRNTFIFSSEIKSLFEYGVPREIRPELFQVYLALTNIPGPDTFYRNIYKLKPGHYIIANSCGYKEYEYWNLPELDEVNMLKNKSSVYDEFSFLLEDSVSKRMRADVPFGAFLSGGLDSSSIVALMSAVSSVPVETFTIGFPQKAFDESRLAQLVANKFKTNHHLGTVNPDSLEKAVKRSVFYFDEPFGDSSSIPTYQVSEFASGKVKMVLTGDGGDEILSGYNSYKGVKLNNFIVNIPKCIKKSVLSGSGFLAKHIKGNYRYKINRLESVFNSANLPFFRRIANKRPYSPLSTIKELTAPINCKIGFEEYLEDIVTHIPYKDDFYRLMWLDFKCNLPDDYLVKVDRMSMANSLETRVPFLDYRLIEFMVKVDKNIKMQGWERKSILRKTIGKQLPPELLTAPKRGFGVPIREWLRMDKSLEGFQLTNLRSICNSSTISRIIAENRKGERDNGNFIWTMIMLDEMLK